ncbi:MAG: protein-disulfide reductase DsbD domain-containing protein [bacterium]
MSVHAGRESPDARSILVHFPGLWTAWPIPADLSTEAMRFLQTPVRVAVRLLALVPLGIPLGLALGAATPVALAQSAAPGVIPGGGFGKKQSEPQTGEDAVKVSTVVVGEAKPGSTVRVAVTFRIHPGWHIYWENPGESGAPTDLGIELPAGCTALEREPGKPRIDFPIPQVFSHGETTFGYENEVTLSFPVTLSSDPTVGAAGVSLPAKLTARWLVCKERCLMGSFAGSVDLAKPVMAESPEAKRLTASLARVPKPLPADWKVTLENVADEAATLVVESPGPAPLRFIPFDTPGAGLDEAYLADSKLGRLEAELRLSRESTLGKPLEVGGIVIVGNAGEAYSFRIPVPGAAK